MPWPGTSWENESTGAISGTPISGIPRYLETRHPYMIPISVLISCNIVCDIRNSDIGNTQISGDPTSVYDPDIGVFSISEYTPISEFTRYRVYSDIGYFQNHTRYRVQYLDIRMSGTLTQISEFAKNPEGRPSPDAAGDAACRVMRTRVCRNARVSAAAHACLPRAGLRVLEMFRAHATPGQAPALGLLQC